MGTQMTASCRGRKLLQLMWGRYQLRASVAYGQAGAPKIRVLMHLLLPADNRSAP